MTNIAIENGPVEIVDFPSYKMVDLSTTMLVYQRVEWGWTWDFACKGLYIISFRASLKPNLKAWYQWYLLGARTSTKEAAQHPPTLPNFQVYSHNIVVIGPSANGAPKLKAGADGSPHLATFQGHQFLWPSRIYIGHLFQETKEQMPIGPGSWPRCLPSGKRLQKAMENSTIYSWENQLFRLGHFQ